MAAQENIRRLLSSSPVIAGMLWEFNFHPAPQLHASRRQQVLPDLPAPVWQSVRALPRLSVLILRQHGLEAAPCFDVPHRQWPLALLSAERLHRLARHLGALALGVHVRASLARDHVLAWRARLGEDAYRFAMNSAALVPASRLPMVDKPDDSPEDIGYSLIDAAVRTAPDAMRERIRLKLPLSIPHLDIDPAQAGRLAEQVMRIVEAEWVSSFDPIRT